MRFTKPAILIFFLLLPAVLGSETFLKQIMEEGETKVYHVGEYEYTVTLSAVFDTKLKAQFEINGEKSDVLGEDDRHKFSDGTEIQVRSVLPQESGDGRDMVQFNLFTAKSSPSVSVTGPEESEVPGETVAEPTTVSAAHEGGVDKEPAAVVEPAPTRGESQVDMTRKKPETSWWARLKSWLKNLFA